MSLLYRYMTLILIIVVAGIFQASADHLHDNSAFQSMKNLPLYPDKISNGCLDHHTKNIITIQRSSALEGFHRHLITQIKFQVEINPVSNTDQCTILLVEKLPTGIYVDLDQLAEIERLHKDISGISPDKIDVEKPAYLSPEHLLLIYYRLNQASIINNSENNTNKSFKVEIPIHLRYQQPDKDGHSYVQVIMPPPMLILIHCLEEPSQLQCQSKYTAPCSNSNRSSCIWNLLYDNENQSLNNEVTFEVPVGLLKHKMIVAVGTSISVIVGTIILIVAIRNAINTPAT